MRERKKSVHSSDALVKKKQLSKFNKKNQCFLIKTEHPLTHTQGVLNFYRAVCNGIQTLEDGFIRVSVTQQTCFSNSFDPLEKGYISQLNH